MLLAPPPSFRNNSPHHAHPLLLPAAPRPPASRRRTADAGRGPPRPASLLAEDGPARRLLPPRDRPGLPRHVRQRPERPGAGDLRRDAAQDLRPAAAKRGEDARLPAGAP